MSAEWIKALPSGSSLLGLGSWISGMVMGKKDREQRQEMFDQNFQLQSQQFQYEKDLQEKMFEREDNAVQRRVADLRAAGLNPSLAAGSAASAGHHVPVHAPQQEYADRSAEMNVMAAAMNLMKMEADISISRQEARRLRNENKFNERTMPARVAAVESDSQFKTDTFDDRVLGVALSNDKTRIENEVSAQRKELYSAEVDKVKVDTALNVIELELKKELDAVHSRFNEYQERLLALVIANDIKRRDAQALHDLGVPSGTRGPLTGAAVFVGTNLARLLDVSVGSVVRAVTKDDSYRINFGTHDPTWTKERRRMWK